MTKPSPFGRVFVFGKFSQNIFAVYVGDGALDVPLLRF